MAGKKVIVLQNAPKTKNNKNNKSKEPKQSMFTGPSKKPPQLNLNQSKMQPDTIKYQKGLINPFSDMAIGSRVPDQYFAPTVTYAIREFLTLRVDANGEFDVVISPNPIFVAWSSRNSISNGTSLTTKDGTTLSNGAYLNSSSSLSGKVSNYRVVNWGIRIRQTQSINTTQGTLTAALFVPKDGLLYPSVGALSSSSVGGQTFAGASWATSTLGQYIQDAGLPSTGSGPTGKIDVGSLVDFPYHMRASCVNAAENSYEIVPKLVSPTALHFRATKDSLFGTDITGQTSAVFIQPGDSSYLQLDGWTNIVLSGTGLAINTAGAVDVEIVYNIEGNPNTNIAAGSGANIAIATGVRSTHDPLGMLLAQAALGNCPAFKLVDMTRAAFKAFGGIMN